jgi:hypothetical protein
MFCVNVRLKTERVAGTSNAAQHGEARAPRRVRKARAARRSELLRELPT